MIKNIKTLFKNLSCSICRKEFNEDSFQILHKDGDLLTVQMICKNCGKDFGLAYLNIKDGNEPLEIHNGPATISGDDVLDAHKFIKNMDKDWQNYLPKSE